MTPYRPRMFKEKDLYEAYFYVLEDPYNIAIHENSFTPRQPGYHVFGTDPEILKRFGGTVNCSKRMFSVLYTHGRKEWKGHVIFHYDDWRYGIESTYERICHE